MGIVDWLERWRRGPKESPCEVLARRRLEEARDALEDAARKAERELHDVER